VTKSAYRDKKVVIRRRDVSLTDIDPHWHFKLEDGPTAILLPPALEESRILEPETIQTPGRPKKKNPKKADTST